MITNTHLADEEYDVSRHSRVSQSRCVSEANWTPIERVSDAARLASARGSDADGTLDARGRGVRLSLSSTVHHFHQSQKPNIIR